MSLRVSSAALIMTFVIFSCNETITPVGGQGSNEPERFKLLEPERTGVQFQNDLEMDEVMNIFNYMYFYNGGGVAVADLNDDDLPDLYFTANQGDNHLYINRGDFKFEDVTERAGIGGQTGWSTGVTMADVNGDGRTDIYVSQLGQHMNYRGHNQLYINRGTEDDGTPVFAEESAKYGLNLVGYATQAVFFDYDQDNDLDLFQLNHSVHKNGTFGRREALNKEPHPLSGDRLLRNDEGKFVDVTGEAGIISTVLGYGLGVSVADINLDGWQDLYVGNDFHENDYLYLNQGDGTFREALAESLPHTSRFSMGSDIGDINGDTYPDIISLDMLPEDYSILKRSAAEDPFDIFAFKLGFGYNHQYARNTLQLNRGPVPGKPGEVRFSDIALQAGVAATDWSWSSLFVDMDNDGRQDIFIANGILGRSNDMDYINYLQRPENRAPIESDVVRQHDLELTKSMPEIKVPNYAFRNLGDLNFENVSAQWGLAQDSYSNGAAYADLDNDGDLDLIVNNVNDPAFIYRNLTVEQGGEVNYLRLTLNGPAGNTAGLGTRVLVRRPGEGSASISRQLQTTRGYLSAVDPRLHIGMGAAELAEEVVVIWPDGRQQVIKEMSVGSHVIRYTDAVEVADDEVRTASAEPGAYFRPEVLTKVRHEENMFFEFNREKLLPFMNSAEGPALAVADLNGDGVDEIFLGGGKRQTGSLLVATAGNYDTVLPGPWQEDALNEDTDACFIDVDLDGDLDLLVASGGNEFDTGHEANQLRLYRNDGNMAFTRDQQLLPDLRLTAAVLMAMDIDDDGDTDLFVGGRAVTNNYGEIPHSYLLENTGGRLVDASDKWLGISQQLGFIKGGVWSDYDQDGRPDLLLAGDWAPIRVFRNTGSRLEQVDIGVERYAGLWNCIVPGDYDGDGDVDYFVGNSGTNSKLSATQDKPMRMYYADFDGNGKREQLLTTFYGGEERPFATRDELYDQIPSLKTGRVKYAEFAASTLKDLFPAASLAAADLFEVTTLASGILWNEGGSFDYDPLEGSAIQYSTFRAGHALDVNQDGIDDLLAFGNFYESNIQHGRYDASYGELLYGSKDRAMEALPMYQSGLDIRGQVRKLVPIKTGKAETALLLGRNNDSPVLLRRVRGGFQ